MNPDTITNLIGDLWSDDVAREVLERFREKVRREALIDARDATPIGEFIDAGGWHDGFKAGCTAKTDAIRALIEREGGGDG